MDGQTAKNIVLITRENAASMSKNMPLLVRLALKRLINLKHGCLTIQWPNETLARIKGENDGVEARINLKNFNLAKRVLKNGDIGVAESYMDGEWDSPNITAVLQLFCQNSHMMIAKHRNFFSKLFLKAMHWHNMNTKRGSKRNIAAHYDLGNSFYKTWLDPSMTYSSALYKHENMNLYEAQQAKYANLAELASMKEGDHILEIGCGWGGFAEYAASSLGCRVTALTISKEQFDYAQKRIFKAGLNEKVSIQFRDYRDEKGQYDHIASIEMFEAVGEKYWLTYFDTLQNCLKPGGTAAVQVITIKDDLFQHYRQSTDFIQRYIFPGGMLPSPEILVQLGSQHALHLSKDYIFGHDYARTLTEWRENFHIKWPEISTKGFDEHFKRMWEFYMHYCEAGFRSENIDVRQMAFTKQG